MAEAWQWQVGSASFPQSGRVRIMPPDDRRDLFTALAARGSAALDALENLVAAYWYGTEDEVNVALGHALDLVERSAYTLTEAEARELAARLRRSAGTVRCSK